MQYEPGFPKQMVHPSYQPARLSMDIAATASTPGYFAPAGSPARFLPETVHSRDQEADMRARGYLDVGEPPAQTHYAEYPKILRHPHHSPAVKATQRSVVRRVNGEDQVDIIPVPAREERFPDKIVESNSEEEHWRNQGWAPAGTWDSDAFERAHTVPEVDYDPQEWPKWIDGKICENPDAVPAAELARQAHEYPKWVNGRRVESAAQEAALANGDVAVPVGSVRPEQRYVPPAVAAPQPVLDVAALKAEIIGELVPQIRDVIREALAPPPAAALVQYAEKPIPHAATSVINEVVTRKSRAPLSEEQRKAIGERLKAGRAAKRAEKAE